jgi:hypothetical protein
MDRRFAKEARRRRYVIRVNAAGWFRTQVCVNGSLHRTTECYAEEQVRRLTRQFEREVADLVADGWAEATRADIHRGCQRRAPSATETPKPFVRSRPYMPVIILLLSRAPRQRWLSVPLERVAPSPPGAQGP